MRDFDNFFCFHKALSVNWPGGGSNAEVVGSSFAGNNTISGASAPNDLIFICVNSNTGLGAQGKDQHPRPLWVKDPTGQQIQERTAAGALVFLRFASVRDNSERRGSVTIMSAYLLRVSQRKWCWQNRTLHKLIE
jgi:hypothetical protein